MVSASFERAPPGDWQQEFDRPDGRPLLALVAGGTAILALLAIAFNAFAFDLLRNSGPALVTALTVAALAWGAAWLLTLREATCGWRIGTALAFAGIAVTAVAAGAGSARIAIRRDIATLRAIRMTTAGKPELPRGATPGPIARRGLAFFGEIMDERHYRDGLLTGLGTGSIANAPELAARPGLLRDCGRFARAKPLLDKADARIAGISVTFRASLGGLVPDPVLRDQVLAAFDTAAAAEKDDAAHSARLQRMQLDLAGDLCRLLAPHRWQVRNGTFLFTTPAQLRQFDSLIQRWNASVRDQQEIAARSRARMAASGSNAGNL